VKILFLSRWFPYPVNNGSKLRINGLLRELAKHHEVTLASFADQPDVRLDAPELQSICSAVHVVPWREFNPQSWRARMGLFSMQPRFLIDTYSNEMAELIRTLTGDHKFDLIIASQLSMAAYYPCFGDTPAIFEELELGQFYDKIAATSGYLERLRLSLTWFKLRLYLVRLLDSFRMYTTASEQERHLFARHFSAYEKKLTIVPNCIQVSDYQGLEVKPVANQLVYSGSFRFYANYDAMQWFVSYVFPKVLERIPDAQLLVTGDHADLPLSSTRNVTLTGYVDDVKALIAASAISLAPIWSGGGTRLKILEAMAIGVPVVATSKGAEGLGTQNEEHLLIADTSEAFAECIIRILNDRDLRDRLVANASLLVKENYDWPVVAPRFLRLMESIVTE